MPNGAKINSMISGVGKLVKHLPWLDSKLQMFRRKVLSKFGGYPDWQNIISKDSINWLNTLSAVDPDRKILIATSIGSHLAAMQMESSIAVALTLRKAEVHILLCDELLPGCQMCEPRFFPSSKSFAYDGPQKSLCRDCYGPAKKVYEQISVKVHAYSDYLTVEEQILAKKIARQTPFDAIEQFCFDGVNIGEHAKAGALRFFARATLAEEPYADQVLRRYLEAALLTAIATRNLLKLINFTAAVFHHGIYVPQGVIGEVARQQGVRVVNWNPAYRKNCFIFSHNDTYHHTLMTEPVATWQEMPWSPEKDDTITAYLQSRWKGDNDWIRFQEDTYFEKDKTLSEIGCDNRRPIIGLLTNVMWDAQLHYPANAFPDMLAWLFFTVHWFAQRPDLQLVIRIHPAEILGSVPTRQPVAEELRSHFTTLPANVFIVPPESKISTYVLSELCDSVVIYGTKTGVELTSVGIPVIVAGEAWIRNKGLTYDAQNKEEYAKLLERLPLKSRLSPEQVQQARKYAYHFFFRRMIPVNIFKQGPGWPPYKVAVRGLEALQPGADPGLDCICNGILNGTPFVYDSHGI